MTVLNLVGTSFPPVKSAIFSISSFVRNQWVKRGHECPELRQTQKSLF